MKMRLMTAAVIGALALNLGCEKKAKLETDMQKASYAIGQQIGQNLKQQNIEFDSLALAESLKDVAKGEKPKMKQEEMQAALMKLQEMTMKKQSEAADKNKKEGDDFLEKNKSAQGVTVTKSGLQYQVITEGTGKMPSKSDTVKCHYKGTLINGEQFDSSYDRGQPAEFPVQGVIAGWSEALQMMKVGSKWKLFVPPDLGYGASGRPGIPPNSVLVFEVELIGIK